MVITPRTGFDFKKSCYYMVTVYEPTIILASDALCFWLQKLYPKPFPWDLKAKVKSLLQIFKNPWYHREPGWFNPKPRPKEE